MTVSPDRHPEEKYSNVTEGDVAQRPEEESSQSTALKILLVVALIAVGVLGIYVAVVLFSAALQGPFEGPAPEVEQRQQTPAEEANQPLEETIPVD
ncbi:hypothetical protein FIV42_19135 [Persicimonas caeni]|jgi:flagellar basal body-associated protein FliL|uniref:Uncharacterized protein n=1 Tax=Persicimonas caeni TaxID=2292766 RepID=A0A4Y6PX19_PERCE|nr:hypothetical protein [Persicimonas caeni]QDG52780.1 hypothetical protein FIV42_19135 [Persicimonas caeni]QED34002.1 hypothetical protein FRD00_19130 [Persicimonas caeni]